MLSTLATAPSILSAFTELFKEPSEMYPMEEPLPSTEVITTSVLFVISAVSTVISTFLPCAFFTSTPKSSMNAPRVPEPASREITVIVSLIPDFFFPHAETDETHSAPITAHATNLVIFIYKPPMKIIFRLSGYTLQNVCQDTVNEMLGLCKRILHNPKIHPLLCAILIMKDNDCQIILKRNSFCKTAERFKNIRQDGLCSFSRSL